MHQPISKSNAPINRSIAFDFEFGALLLEQEPHLASTWPWTRQIWKLDIAICSLTSSAAGKEMERFGKRKLFLERKEETATQDQVRWMTWSFWRCQRQVVRYHKDSMDSIPRELQTAVRHVWQLHIIGPPPNVAWLLYPHGSLLSLDTSTLLISALSIGYQPLFAVHSIILMVWTQINDIQLAIPAMVHGY